MYTIKDFEAMIPDKIVGVEQQNKNTVIFITNGKIRLMHRERFKNGIK